MYVRMYVFKTVNPKVVLIFCQHCSQPNKEWTEVNEFLKMRPPHARHFAQDMCDRTCATVCCHSFLLRSTRKDDQLQYS